MSYNKIEVDFGNNSRKLPELKTVKCNYIENLPAVQISNCITSTNMLKNPKVAKRVSDAAWSGFCTKVGL